MKKVNRGVNRSEGVEEHNCEEYRAYAGPCYNCKNAGVPCELDTKGYCLLCGEIIK